MACQLGQTDTDDTAFVRARASGLSGSSKPPKNPRGFATSTVLHSKWTAWNRQNWDCSTYGMFYRSGPAVEPGHIRSQEGEPTSKQLQKLAKQIKNKGPCVVLWDRPPHFIAKDITGGEAAAARSQFRQLLDGPTGMFNGQAVLFIGTTNQFAKLEPDMVSRAQVLQFQLPIEAAASADIERHATHLSKDQQWACKKENHLLLLLIGIYHASMSEDKITLYSRPAPCTTRTGMEQLPEWCKLGWGSCSACGYQE